MRNLTKSVLTFICLTSSVMAASSVIINDTVCTLRLAKNTTKGMTKFEIPALIHAKSRVNVTAEFPESGWYSSHSVFVAFNIHCEDDDIPDGGIFEVFNFSDDERALGACLTSNTLRMYPTWTHRNGVQCGELIDHDGFSSTLKITAHR